MWLELKPAWSRIIATDVPGCREIVEDGKNGFLFEVKDAVDLEEKIIQFIELSEEQKVSMGKFSRQKVEKEFDRKIVVEEYMKAIGKIGKKDFYEKIITNTK